MPRIMGVNILGALLAAVAMFFVGFLFYGLLFTEIWMDARGFTEAQLEGQSGAWMAGGFLIELVLAFGLGWVMKAKGASTMGSAIGTALALSILIGFPMLAYEFVYGAHHSLPGILVDWGHTVVAFVLGAVILSFFD